MREDGRGFGAGDRAAAGRLPAWIGFVFCFVLFPAGLVLTALHSHLDGQEERQRTEAFRRLEERLDLLEPCQRDAFFWHALLKRIWLDAARDPAPVTRLARSLMELKKRFPGCGRFVVWDGRGTLQEGLTDVRGYRHGLSRTWTALRAVTLAGRGDRGRRGRRTARGMTATGAGDPMGLPEVSGRLAVLRSILGNILVPAHLRFPFLPGTLGSVILADSHRDRSHCWYHVDDRLGMLVFLRWEAVRGHIGLRTMAARLQARAPAGHGVGYALNAGRRRIHVPPGFPWREEIELALGAFDNTSEPLQETPHLLLAIRPMEDGIHGFAWAFRHRVLTDRGLVAGRVAAWLVLVLLPLTALSWASLVRGWEFSFPLRGQLAGVFLFATGLPLVMLAFLGHDYLLNKEATWREQARRDAAQVLRTFDGRFRRMRDRLESGLGRLLAGLEARNLAGEMSAGWRARLVEGLAGLSPTEFYLVSSQSRVLASHLLAGWGGPKFATNHLAMVGYDFLRFFNGQMTGHGEGIRSYEQQGFHVGTSGILGIALGRLGAIHLMDFGAEQKWTCWDIIGDASRRAFGYLLIVFWSESRMQELFLREFLPRVAGNRNGISVVARLGDGGMLRSPGFPALADVSRVFPDSDEPRGKVREFRDRSGQPFLGVGQLGQEMPAVGLGAFHPLAPLEARRRVLFARLVGFGVASLALAVGIGQLLARQFLRPLGGFDQAVRTIEARRFRFRLPEGEDDEFGRLNATLNQTLASLEELDLGRVVQNSLLPPGHFRHQGFAVFGRCETMTDLGGDYFDFFPIDERRCGVILGDVAGHGVPAALVMAFAKAGVELAGPARASPDTLLQSLHGLFQAGRHRDPAGPPGAGAPGLARGLPRAMTMQCAIADGGTGRVWLANAGHCYPVLVRAATGEADFVAVHGCPLGVVRKARFPVVTLDLEPGDLLVLYSDGFAEAPLEAGDQFGFPRLLDLVRSCRGSDGDPEAVCRRVWEGHRHLIREATDDLSLVVMVAVGPGGRA